MHAVEDIKLQPEKKFYNTEAKTWAHGKTDTIIGAMDESGVGDCQCHIRAPGQDGALGSILSYMKDLGSSLKRNEMFRLVCGDCKL